MVAILGDGCGREVVTRDEDDVAVTWVNVRFLGVPLSCFGVTVAALGLS